MDYSSPGLVLEAVLEYRTAVLGLVLEYRRAILVLGLDLRLPVLELDSYSAKLGCTRCISVDWVRLNITVKDSRRGIEFAGTDGLGLH